MLSKNAFIVVVLMVCIGLLAYSAGFTTGRTSAIEDGMVVSYDNMHKDQISASTENTKVVRNRPLEGDGNLIHPDQELAPELLSAVQQAVTEAMQQQLHRELTLALNTILPTMMANTTQSAKAYHDPERVQSIVDHTNDLLNAAIDRGSWGRDDENALTEALQSMPDEAAIIDVSRRLSKAITDGRLVIDTEALFGLKGN